MRRRPVLAAGAAAVCCASFAQGSREPRIGVITWMPQPMVFRKEFLEGMREFGWEEGRNLRIDWRAADARAERVDALVAELIELNVDVIVAEFTPVAMAARKATATIPIVMAPAGDPVSTGLVASLARPGGNVTGLSNIAAELAGKRLELLQQAVPGLTRVGLLVYGRDPLDRSFVDSTREAAAAAGLRLHLAEVPTAADLDRAFASLRGAGVAAAVVPGNLPAEPARAAELALRQRLPTIGVISNWPLHGGLMAYAPNLADLQRRAAGYVDRLLRGAKPQDLPVEQPTRFELVLNGRTARALGMNLPQSLLLRADKVIG
ncbi:MAG: ABC transporter substrate-binding protein [Rubrivivax sp.]|nr:ABC transporter substrate-binding protein [Rubrivivax sp.]